MSQILEYSIDSISIAAQELAADRLVAFPTETVYGLGGNAYSDRAVANIFHIKNRPQFNPISVCYSNLEQASSDVEITDIALKLAHHFLPGPLTIVLKRSENSKISRLCSAGLDSIGIRIPNSAIALDLLYHLPFPLAAPSANISAALSSTTAQNVYDSFKQNITILDGGQCSVGIESTIVDLSSNDPYIVRTGAISAMEIYNQCGIQLAYRQTSPSASLKHYQTKKTIVTNATDANPNDGLLAFGRPFPNKCKYVLNLSETENLTEAASNLFAMLHELDAAPIDRICIMPIPNHGLGIAINSKLH